MARGQQEHQITTHYLDRTLDPKVPLAIRHQLLRFLATPDKAGSRLTGWAKAELERVGGVVDDVNRAVAKAEERLQAAANSTEVHEAERILAEAVRRQRSLLEPPVAAPASAAAARAGLIEAKALNGLVLSGEDLRGARFPYKELRGANFSDSDLTGATFQGSDLRAALFVGANLTSTRFFESDLRGVDFSGAVLRETQLLQARLEGADLSLAKIEADSDFRATYDQTTKWPAGFNPDDVGGVRVDTPPTQ